MTDAEKMWAEATKEAERIIAKRKIMDALQPTVNAILKDPRATALLIFRQMNRINELEAQVVELKKK